MYEDNFIVREPLLDPKQRVVGYELAWQKTIANAGQPHAADLDELLGFVAGSLNDPELGWLLGDNLLFIEVVPGLLSSEALAALSPKNTVLTLAAADLNDPDTLTSVKDLRARGFGISLKDADFVAQDKALLSHVTHIEVCFGTTDFATQAKIYGSLKQSRVRMLARQITSWHEYDASASLGLDAFVGKLHLTPRPEHQSKGLNPAQALILQLMEMVRKNADVRQLESVLKHDAAVSYKLLRYINSAGFGQGREITSLRHAVQVLGYGPLYRWLSLLLATANASNCSPVLMETAIVRGRLAELLGKTSLPKGGAENLFVAGMFSLLDRLLGISMDEALEKIQLPEGVPEALISRGGIYGPFLALAEACELNSVLVSTLATSLQISPVDVNKAHLSALAWAKNLTL